jgi:hypothetical protein
VQDRALNSQILDEKEPWRVEPVELRLEQDQVHVHLEHGPKKAMALCGVRETLVFVRSSAGAAVAAFGYLPVPDDSARDAAAKRWSGAWYRYGQASVGGARKPFYGSIREIGD